ncbi:MULTISPECIES: hypothetical protein [unclassified Streptomyces]|uniref:hypothetical protein n=1 Tax=unclassified Streptomyces TaxID=2593676 RepID=UPI001F2BDDE7|nr:MULTISPECIES: hypothetical protein [unclassified Streptomyces]MCF0086692.1 hypothetical protein [Streptomyces sp. MH192]MCF0098846.1 hypothetical protein [Streptomyces sp. MH191]
MTEQLEETGAISHVGPVPNVSVHAHMRSGPHAVTTDPLDLLVVVELLFLFGEQARRRSSNESLVITPQSVLERLREMGVRSGNGARLVGRDAVYASFGRLREKGYIRRIVLSDATTGQRAGVAYEFYDWPAWNPEAPPVVEFSQVTPTSGNAGSGDAGSSTRNRAKEGSPQVAATSGIAGSGDAGSFEFSQVTPTSGNAGNPPHPPEEVDTSSPYPLTRTGSGTRSQTEEGPEFSPEEIHAAETFLQQMKQWQAGGATARKQASRLLRVMRKQAWPALSGMDDTQRALLESEIFRNTGGAKSWLRCLPGWIDDLRLYDRVRTGAGRGGESRERCADHPARYRVGCIDCAMAVPRS